MMLGIKPLYENEPYSIDYRILRPDGEQRTVHSEAQVFFDATGHPTFG